MWLEQYPIFFFYFMGSFFAVALSLFKIVLFWSIDWTIRANVLQKNMRKLLPPEELSFREKTTKLLLILVLEALFSWISVAVIIWQIFSTIFRVARDQFQPAPEAIEVLRFPLRNNPDMARESVWAYTGALQVRAGQMPHTQDYLLKSLNIVAEYYPTFDRVAALKQLESLNVISSNVIQETLMAVESK